MSSIPWDDVTDFIKETASGLEKGQMIHSEDFSLKQSVKVYTPNPPPPQTLSLVCHSLSGASHLTYINSYISLTLSLLLSLSIPMPALCFRINGSEDGCWYEY